MEGAEPVAGGRREGAAEGGAPGVQLSVRRRRRREARLAAELQGGAHLHVLDDVCDVSKTPFLADRALRLPSAAELAERAATMQSAIFAEQPTRPAPADRLTVAMGTLQAELQILLRAISRWCDSVVAEAATVVWELKLVYRLEFAHAARQIETQHAQAVGAYSLLPAQRVLGGSPGPEHSGAATTGHAHHDDQEPSAKVGNALLTSLVDLRLALQVVEESLAAALCGVQEDAASRASEARSRFAADSERVCSFLRETVPNATRRFVSTFHEVARHATTLFSDSRPAQALQGHGELEALKQWVHLVEEMRNDLRLAIGAPSVDVENALSRVRTQLAGQETHMTVSMGEFLTATLQHSTVSLELASSRISSAWDDLECGSSLLNNMCTSSVPTLKEIQRELAAAWASHRAVCERTLKNSTQAIVDAIHGAFTEGQLAASRVEAELKQLIETAMVHAAEKLEADLLTRREVLRQLQSKCKDHTLPTYTSSKPSAEGLERDDSRERDRAESLARQQLFERMRQHQRFEQPIGASAPGQSSWGRVSSTARPRAASDAESHDTGAHFEAFKSAQCKDTEFAEADKVRARQQQDGAVKRILRTPASDVRALMDLPRSGSLSVAEVTKAFRRQSLLVHPDKNESPDAAKAFVKLNEAYTALRDHAVRIRTSSPCGASSFPGGAWPT